MKIVSGARGLGATLARPRSRRLHAVSGLAALAWVAGCGAGGEDTNKGVLELGGPGSPSAGGNGPNGGTPIFMEGCEGPSCQLAGGPEPAPPGCGDGTLTPDEACDDANRASGDGCAENCLLAESGFSCATPGQPCRPIARCGGGLGAPTEQCDDSNIAVGDGCTDRCRVELGKKCEGQPSVCTDAICGNMVKEGAEACDDGNTLPFDG